MKCLNKMRIVILVGVVFVFSLLFGVINSSVSASSLNNRVFGAIDSRILDNFSQNHILFFNPCGDGSGGGGTWSGEEVTWDDLNKISEGNTREAIALLASTYGELAMALQEEYGVPWELVFIQMGNESGGGVNRNRSVAISIRDKDGKYNLLGMDIPRNRNNNRYASDETYPYTDGANGSSHEAAEYDSISDMIIGYVISYYRNGIYDEALKYWGYENFDFWTGFQTATCHYVGTPGSCSSSYSNPNGNGGWFYDVIADVAKEKNWPSSEELAKKKKIKAGGNWPIKGDSRQEIWAAYGKAGLPSGSSVVTNDEQRSGGEQIAKMAKEFSWAKNNRPSDVYVGNDAYNKAAKELGGEFIEGGSTGKCKISDKTGLCYSCARLVSLALYKSGVDNEFIEETKNMGNKPHMISTNEGGLTYYLNTSDNWEVVEDYDGNGYNELMAGDILLWDIERDGTRADGIKTHTFIYLGNGEVAEASNSDFAPYVHDWDNGNNGYVAYRVKGDDSWDGKDICGTTAANGDFDKNIIKYVWPEYSDQRKDATKDYIELLKKGYYNGGGATDCNGFVSKMIVVNEIDPNYNSGFGTCASTLNTILSRSGWGANWETLYKPGDTIDTSKLKKGDVFLNSTHTFLFIGDIKGFQCDVASASLGDHVPVACNGNRNAANYSNGSFYVFRKK